MKKILSLLVLLALCVSMLVACGGGQGGSGEGSGEQGGSGEGSGAPAKDYKLSIGVALEEDAEGASVAQTVAVIVTDAEGKIVTCRVDCIEYSAFDRSGAFVETAPTSKVALGEDYDSGNRMPAGDWYVQGAAFESYVKGMTQQQVAAITMGNDGKTDLIASCTIAIADLVKAVDNAFKSEHKISFSSAATSFTAGLSAVSKLTFTEKEATETTAACTDVKFSVTFAGAVLVDGAVVASILDTAEPTLNGIVDKESGAASITFGGSKRELGTEYDAYKPMAAGTWYVQADKFALTANGFTKDNIDSLATEGVAGCTINVTNSEKPALEAAVKAAR